MWVPSVAVLLTGAAVGAPWTPVAAVAAAGVVVLLLVRGSAVGGPGLVLAGTAIGGLVGHVAPVPWHVGALAGAAAWALRARRTGAPAGPPHLLATRWSPTVVLATAAVSLTAATVVVWWHRSSGTFYFVPTSAAAWLLVAALVNATAEELVWRSAALAAVERAAGAAVAVTVSSVSFGLAHVASGVPSGWTGAVLAAAYGAAQCLLVRASGSLLLPVLGHLVVDVAVVAAIAGWV